MRFFLFIKVFIPQEWFKSRKTLHRKSKLLNNNMEEFVIKKDLVQHILDLLKERPYKEVHVACVLLEQLPPLESKGEEGVVEDILLEG